MIVRDKIFPPSLNHTNNRKNTCIQPSNPPSIHSTICRPSCISKYQMSCLPSLPLLVHVSQSLELECCLKQSTIVLRFDSIRFELTSLLLLLLWVDHINFVFGSYCMCASCNIVSITPGTTPSTFYLTVGIPLCP